MPNLLKFPKDVGFRSDVQTFAWVITVTSFMERAISFRCQYCNTQVCNGLNEKNQYHILIKDITQPFYVRFCNGVDENFQHHFDINISYCITKDCITNSIIL